MRRTLPVVLAVVLSTSACGGDEPTTEVTGAVGGDVFSGSVEAIDGTDIDLGAFAETDAVVWFWAPW